MPYFQCISVMSHVIIDNNDLRSFVKFFPFSAAVRDLLSDLERNHLLLNPEPTRLLITTLRRSKLANDIDSIHVKPTNNINKINGLFMKNFNCRDIFTVTVIFKIIEKVCCMTQVHSYFDYYFGNDFNT